MKYSKNFWWILIFLVGASVALWAGQSFWLKNKEKYLTGAGQAHSILLFDDDKKLFDNSRLKRGEMIFMVFTPDVLSREEVLPLREFWKEWNMAPTHEIGKFMVSRVFLDEIRNFKRAIGFSGRVLLDPSASIASMYELFSTTKVSRRWCYVLANEKMQPIFTVCAESPIKFKDLVPYLR
jgi:hypothetical protein